MATTSRSQVSAALAEGSLIRLSPGRYASAQVEDSVATAHRLGAVLSHESAALEHGWEVLLPPAVPHVSVSAGRKADGQRWHEVVLHRAEWGPDDVVGVVTSQDRTALDCLRNLEFRRSLAVADSALRAISLEVEGLRLVPQVPLWTGAEFLGRPDLVDVELGIIAEADSFEWHGGRSGLVRDAHRYNAMVTNGWLVLRFTWEDVMFDEARVREVLARATDRRRKVGPPRRRSA